MNILRPDTFPTWRPPERMIHGDQILLQSPATGNHSKRNMWKFLALLLLALLCQNAIANDAGEDTYMGNFYDKLRQKCTAIGLGKKATSDGST